MYSKNYIVILTIILLLSTFLMACGSSNPTSNDTESPTVTAGIDPKTLEFDWSHIAFPADTDHYQLQINPTGDSAFTTIKGAESIQDTFFTLTVPVHLTDWVNAVYRVAAMDMAGDIVFTTSEIDLLTTVAAEEVIGYFKAGTPNAGDWFGYSISLSADSNTLAVGAYKEDGNGIDGETNNDMPSAGAVYVFTRNDNTWSQQAYLKASNTNHSDVFGVAVTLSADGNILAVGAPYEDGNGIDGETNNDLTDAGAVYVFTRSGSTWSQQAYLKASNPDKSDLFGASVTLSAAGDILTVGALYAGAVYVFTRSGSTWSQQAYIMADNALESDEFGYSVSLSADGNTLAVGAPYEDGNGASGETNNMANAGAVYVFTRSGSTWSQQAYLKAGTPYVDDHFGNSVSLSADGNTLAVGAYMESGNGVDGETNNDMHYAGAVYVFTRSSSTWSRQTYIKAGNTNAYDWFGYSVSLSSDGNTLAVGALYESSGETNNDIYKTGAVFVFTNSGSTWSQQAYLKASNADEDDRFGNSVSLSGDGNTLAVGAIGEDGNDVNGKTNNDMPDAGAIYLY